LSRLDPFAEMDTIDGPLATFAVPMSKSRQSSPSHEFKVASTASSIESLSSGDGNHPWRTTDSGSVSRLSDSGRHSVRNRSNFTADGYVLPAKHSSPSRIPFPVTHSASDWNDEGIPFDETPFDEMNSVQNQMAWKGVVYENDIPALSPLAAYSDRNYYSTKNPEKPSIDTRVYLSETDEALAIPIPSTITPERLSTRVYFSETDESLAMQAPPKTKRVTTLQENPIGQHPPRSPESFAFPRDESPGKTKLEPSVSVAKAVLAKWKEEPGYRDDSFHTSDCDPYFETNFDPPERLKEDYEEFGLTPGSITEEGNQPLGSEKANQLVSTFRSSATNPSDDDDSLFDFGEETRRLSSQLPLPNMTHDTQSAVLTRNAIAANQRRGRRGRRHSNVQEDSDADTSLDADYGVIRQRSSSLQARAQEAFKTRLPRVKEKAQSNPTQRMPSGSPKMVKFDQMQAIHNVFPDENDKTAPALSTEVNVDCIKSIESEVEDAIKDLFFIGDATSNIPGRRKVKNQSAMADDSPTVLADDSTVNDSVTLNTLNTLDESTLDGTSFADVTSEKISVSASKNPSSIQGQALVDEDANTFTAMWGMVEESINVMGAVLGISPASEGIGNDEVRNEETESVSRELHQSSLSAIYSPVMALSTEQTSFDLFDVFRQSAPKITDTIILKPGPHDEDSASQSNIKSKSTVSGKSLEQDLRLSEFALHTARSVHSLNGVKFNEAEHPNAITQMDFIYVKVGLPLGILFQENSGGCWVARVLEDGNAEKANVKVGDQLGAIDGVSAIKMTVDDICKAVSQAANPSSIELTFLRYSGPLRSSELVTFDEGYELEVPLSKNETEEEYAPEEVLSRTATEPITCVTIPPTIEKGKETKHQDSVESKKKSGKKFTGKVEDRQSQTPEVAVDIQKRGLGRLFSRKKK